MAYHGQHDEGQVQLISEADEVDKVRLELGLPLKIQKNWEKGRSYVYA